SSLKVDGDSQDPSQTELTVMSNSSLKFDDGSGIEINDATAIFGGSLELKNDNLLKRRIQSFSLKAIGSFVVIGDGDNTLKLELNSEFSNSSFTATNTEISGD